MPSSLAVSFALSAVDFDIAMSLRVVFLKGYQIAAVDQDLYQYLRNN